MWIVEAFAFCTSSPYQRCWLFPNEHLTQFMNDKGDRKKKQE